MSESPLLYHLKDVHLIMWNLVESNHVSQIFSLVHPPGLPKFQSIYKLQSSTYFTEQIV